MLLRWVFIGCLLLGAVPCAWAQYTLPESPTAVVPQSDSTLPYTPTPSLFKRLSDHQWTRPEKSMALSLLLPGAGQAYNRHYWKIPLVYGLMGGTGYYLVYNQQIVNRFDKALDIRFDNDPATFDEFEGVYSPTQLYSLRTGYRRTRDYAFLGLLGAWMFQALDANVSGHLYDFDVSRNLGLRLKTNIKSAQMTFNF